MVVKKGMSKAVEAAVAEAQEAGQEGGRLPTTSPVSALSPAADEEIGKLIADAMEKVSADGVITVEESKTAETYS